MADATIARFGLLSNRKLFLILMPTEQCNLRCSYCYEDFLSGRMNRATRNGVKALMARRAAKLDLLAIEWFGGEPLLAPDIVAEIQDFAWRLSESHGLELRGSMTTNATLLKPSLLRSLVRTGVTKYQITLDGDRELHDSQRCGPNGSPSFARIWSHLREAKTLSENFHIDLRLHVSQASQDRLRAFVRTCWAEFGGDPRFGLAFRAIRRLGGPNDASLPVLPEPVQKRCLAELSDYAERLGFTVDRGPFASGTPRPGCYAAAAYSLVVRSNGDLAKCTVALRHPANRVGRLLESGKIEVDQEKFSGWLRGVFSGRERELRCPAKGYADTAGASPLRVIAG